MSRTSANRRTKEIILDLRGSVRAPQVGSK